MIRWVRSGSGSRRAHTPESVGPSDLDAPPSTSPTSAADDSWSLTALTSQAAVAAGVSVERGLLALSVGDQLGNLVAPFWYVIVAGIARLDFRRFFGYGLLFAALRFVTGVVSFTFLPV